MAAAVSGGLSVGGAGTVMAAGSCAGVGEAGGFEWAQPERNTADATRSSVAVRRRGFALRHELIVAFLRMGLRRSLSHAPRAKPRRPPRRRPGWDAGFLTPTRERTSGVGGPVGA